MKNGFLFCLVFSYHYQVQSQATAPLVKISDGLLKGASAKTIREKVLYYAYRGIPYAEKPVGNLRFASPIKNGPWTGILDATSDKSECVQIKIGAGVSGTQVIGSEDCLFINVYTTNVNGNLPVMVWIYGGGFRYGDSKYESFAPDYFLENEVIFVSFNYRLGIFGFLSTEDIFAPGNWGLKDQVLALNWVKNNIQHFGGNPNKITIFGESAGSASVSYLLQSDLTKGLYNGAIMESGSSLCLWTRTLKARKKAFSVGIELEYVTLDPSKLVEYLRSVDYKKLKLAENNVTVTEALTHNILAGVPFGVVEEPEHLGAVVTGKSWEKLLKGEFQHVPIIIGFNSNEGGVYFNTTNPYSILFKRAFQDVSSVAPHDLTQNKIKRLIAGAQIKQHFVGSGSALNNTKGVTRFVTNDQFERPIREDARLSSKYTDVYYYKFSYEGKLGSEYNNFQGVGHSQELHYLFLLYPFNRIVNKQDAKFIQKFVTLWTNFAKTGNPTPNELGHNSVLDNVLWEPNNSKNDATFAIKYLDINETLSIKVNPFQNDWTFYQEIYQRLGDPPYSTY